MTLSRRDFLGLSSGGLFLSACQLTPPQYPALKRARVIVVGGGFGGLNVAKAIKRLAPECPVTLIDRDLSYTRCLGSNLVIGGFASEQSLQQDLPSPLAAKNITFQVGEVVRVSHNPSRLHLADGQTLPFDRLILSPGIDFRWDQVPGMGESLSGQIPHAYKGGQAGLLAYQIKNMRQGGTLIITAPQNPYRCPPGPYERASLVAAYFKQHNPKAKILILDAKSRFSKQKAFTAAWDRYYPGMIEWISYETEGEMDHVDAPKRTVHMAFNRFRADVLNVIPPQKAGRLGEQLGLTDASGWCDVDPMTFESRRHPRIHVIGDAATIGPMPKSAFAAQAQARACAVAVIQSLLGRPPLEPRLINHCYSFIDQQHAISITGVYGFKAGSKELITLSQGETPPGALGDTEAAEAQGWYQLILEQTFG